MLKRPPGANTLRGERRRARIVVEHVREAGEGGFGGKHDYVIFVNLGRVPAHDVRVFVYGQDKGTAALRIEGDEGDSVNPVSREAYVEAGGKFNRIVSRRLIVGNPHRLIGEISWRDSHRKRVAQRFELDLG